MNDYILLMHDDAPPSSAEKWAHYLELLRGAGRFAGGSAIGTGICARKDAAQHAITSHLSGYIRVTALDLDDARTLLAGNPVYEAGGTVEIRELPRR